LGKIKILHPQKHPISYSYEITNMEINKAESSFTRGLRIACLIV